jgi:hypothetical protein
VGCTYGLIPSENNVVEVMLCDPPKAGHSLSLKSHHVVRKPKLHGEATGGLTSPTKPLAESQNQSQTDGELRLQMFLVPSLWVFQMRF